MFNRIHKYLLFVVLFIAILFFVRSINTTEAIELTLRQPFDTLIRVPNEGYELGDRFCYLNQHGDTVVPFAQYALSYSDTIIHFGIVSTTRPQKPQLIAIDAKGKEMFQVYFYDNGPDYLSEGLFRIEQNGKIGYADSVGNIIIRPQYACAEAFHEGKAKVSYECSLKQVDEHSEMQSDTWFYITKTGEKVN